MLLLGWGTCDAQDSKPLFTHDIRSSAGNELTTTDDEPFVTFTIGEPIVQTIIEPDNIASQGFQQPFFKDIPCPIYIANAFTPRNFDELNDDFGPIHECKFESIRFIIFDRWGQLIFESFEEHPRWDGLVNGEPAQHGLYPWVLKYKMIDDYGDKIRVMRGAVSVVR